MPPNPPIGTPSRLSLMVGKSLAKYDGACGPGVDAVVGWPAGAVDGPQRGTPDRCGGCWSGRTPRAVEAPSAGHGTVASAIAVAMMARRRLVMSSHGSVAAALPARRFADRR